MRIRASLALLAVLSLGEAARAGDPVADAPTALPPPDRPKPPPAPPAEPPAAAPAPAADEPAARPRPAPVLTGSSAAAAAEVPKPELVTFKGAALINEFTYRAILQLPDGAKATPQTARAVVSTLAAFLRDAGYDLAKVRAQVKGEQIEVTIDEGALDKIIITGVGWLAAFRFRAALNLPLDIFNHPLFEQQIRHMAKQFGLLSYRYELWPVHLLDIDNAEGLGDIEELRAMPMLRPARGYELRIFAESNPWSSGFSPEIQINGAIGLGLGGRYRWKDLLQDGDRWQVHFRVGGAFRSYLDEDGGGSRLVNSSDYVSARWLSRSWGNTARGLRMTISPRGELWTLQRKDLSLESYRIGTYELPAGFGSNLTPEFSLFVTAGWQRRWVFDLDYANGSTPIADVSKVPGVSNRVFLRLNSQYTFNPSELRQDVRDFVAVELNAYRPTVKDDDGYVRIDVQGHWLWYLGWHELRLGGRLTAELGNIWFVDEVALSDHLRIGFGLEKYTQRMASTSLEFRYSLLRDKLKIGAFTDLALWRHLPRVDPDISFELAGSSGAGIFFFVLDELQIDAFYGVGWSTDHFLQPGLALAIKEAF